MTGKGKCFEIDGVEGCGGSSSVNKLHNNCYFLRNGEPILNKDSCLLLSNPHSGHASALAPHPLRGPGGQHGHGLSSNFDHLRPCRRARSNPCQVLLS